MPKKITNDIFIKKIKKKHNNFYDYTLTNYVNMKTKIDIICPEHGIFKQIAQHHLNGSGCPKCANRKKSENKQKTKIEFILKSNKIHNNYYSYDKSIYINNKTPIIITCPIHGDFKQRPDNHLQGKGCYFCGVQKNRIRRIKEIEKDKFNGNQIIPSYNPEACKIFDEISEKNNIHIQHAMNGGEYYIKELGYWVDGYDEENNIVYEYDEKHHRYQKEKDKIREEEIKNFLKCDFIRIKENKIKK